MEQLSVAELNTRFGTEQVRFLLTGKKQVPAAVVSNSYGSCTVTLFGAHLISCIPAGQQELLMMTRECEDESTTLFGGVPVCWPWFGMLREPCHGFARSRMWEVSRTSCEPDGSTILELRFFEPESCNMEVYFELRLGKKLELKLTTVNRSSETQELSEAFHTYFRVGEISRITLTGLKDQPYIDAVGGKYLPNCVLHEPEFKVNAEVDYVFDSSNTVILTDPVLKRKIRIEKKNSNSTVVWNPWVEESKNIPGFGPGEFHNMICVEAANAFEHRLHLAPGETHSMSQIISTETL